MTATPRFFTDKVREEAKEIEYEIASMDEESKFGPVFHKLSYSEAIKKDLLSDYRVVIVGVDDPTYREYAEQGTFVTTDGEHITDARILASQIAVGKAMKKYDLRRIISFHSRIKFFIELFDHSVDKLHRAEHETGLNTRFSGFANEFRGEFHFNFWQTCSNSVKDIGGSLNSWRYYAA